MKVVMRNIGTIEPYEKNAKLHPDDQVGRIAASIREFGFNQPIVVDKAGVIIVGHGRYVAAQSLGMDEVPVLELDIPEDKARAYRLADNKLNESSWDMDLVITELKGLTVDLIDLTGFSRDLLLDKVEDEDEVPPEPATPQSVLGDLYELGPHRVLCGSSISMDDMVRLMGDTKSHMVFTDPPWNVAIGGDKNPKHRQREGLINDDLGEDFHLFLKDVGTCIASFNAGDVYCVMGCEEWPTIHKALTDASLHWSATIIWVKDQFVLGRSKYHRRYEPIWYGWLDKSSYVGDRKQDDVWEVPRPKKSEEHPTMKPVELVEMAIKNSSNRGDVVLDVFLGGGSTLIASEKLGRACYGMEISPKFVDVIVERWVKFTGNTKIKKNGEDFIWKKESADEESEDESEAE